MMVSQAAARLTTGVGVYVVLLTVAVTAAPSQKSSLSPWTIRGCYTDGKPYNHPIFTNKLGWLKVKKLLQMSKQAWVYMHGSFVYANLACNLQEDVLYKVTVNGDIFTYTPHPDDGSPVSCTSKQHIISLSPTSYGFASCLQTREQVLVEMAEWWSSIPLSYITVVLISLAVVMVVVAAVGVAVCVVVKRRSRGAATLVS